MVEGSKSGYASLQSSTVIMPSAVSTPASTDSLHIPTPAREYPAPSEAFATRVSPPPTVASGPSIITDDDRDSIISFSDASSFLDVDEVNTATTESGEREPEMDEFDFVDEVDEGEETPDEL